MNSIQTLLSEIRQHKIQLWVENERLRFSAPPGVMNPQLKEEIKNHQPEIIAFLQQFKTTNSNLIPVVSREGELPLSFTQERLWFLTQLDQTSASYNMQTTLTITGQLNIIALEKAINFLVQRHESLRTNFINNQGIAQVIIKPEISTPLSIIELKDIQEINTILEEQKSKIFDLEKDNLLHFTLLKITPEEQILMITMHHIISDGWSMELLTRELSELYQSFDENKTPTLKPLPIQYLDFAAWQRNSLTEKALKNKLKFWQQHLENISPLSTFPSDYPRPKIQTFTGATYKQIINNSLKNKLKNLTKTEGVTLFITLLTAFQVLLYRHTGQEKLVIGYPHVGRNNVELENLIGFFANTLLVSSNLSGNPSFKEFLEQIKNFVFQSYEYQDLPFEKLVEELNPERNLSYNPLFQVWFNMLNLESKPLELIGLEVESYSESENNTDVNSKFDLTIYVRENPDYLELNWVYNRDLYSEKTINWLADQYQVLLVAITENPETQINNLPLIIKEDSEKISSLNQQIIPNPCFQEFLEVEIEQSIPKRFEKIVKNNPQQIAIISNNQELTYKELNEKANQIASLILELAPSDCQQIGILLGHEYTTIAAILGVLKTGKTYICLDPTYPKSRLKYILKDSQTKIIITNNQNLGLAEELKDNQLLITNIESIKSNRNYSKDDLNLSISSANIAYILYTSGSTGHPKGVIQNHRNVLHFIRNYTNNLKINSEDKLSLLASPSFDAAVMDILGALLNGATLCLYDVKSEGLNKLPQWLNEEKITIYHSTPTLYRYVIKELNQESKNQFPYLRLIVLGGEEVVKKDLELYQEYFSDNCVFINGYGPTESTVTLQYFINKNTTINTNLVPIGYPIENTEILLLDKHKNETQIYGEIGIKSEYVALGYWQQPELTNKVFFPDSKDIKKRIYRTGDFGKLRSDGTIAFLGRKDFQVKIRGFRIELGEIETVLNSHPQIEESLVIAYENEQQHKQLVAYIIPDQKQVPNPTELRKYLQEKLPEYMIPTAYIPLEAFPLTPNGKIDRKALPKPEREHSLSTEIILPRTETEKKLAQIWQEILWLDQEISINDNFFDLGGHSLLSVKLVAEIEKEFEQKLPLQALFKLGTIADIAEILDQKIEPEEPVITTTIIKQENTLNPEIYHQLFAYTAGWKGERINPNSLVFGHNLNGKKPPLFWVLQGYRELSQLANYLGEDQLIYGMRSGHLIIENYTDENLEQLANYYANEIREIQPNEPYFIGGNCQSALIATEIAKQLQKQGKKVALLSLLENSTYQLYEGKIAFLFGRDSNEFNPYKLYHNPELTWQQLYPFGFSVKIISGIHGQYFDEPNIQDLAKNITELLTVTSQEIDENKTIFSQEKYQAKITVPETLNLPPNQSLQIPVSVTNISPVKWEKTEKSNLKLGNHWLNTEDKYIQWLDGISHLDQAILPEETAEILLTINTPEKEGQYVLEIDLVEEGITWFKNKRSPTAKIITDINSQSQYINPEKATNLSENSQINDHKIENQGDIFFEKGDYRNAIKNYQNFLTKNTQNLLDTYYKLAYSYYKTSELESALFYCNKYLEIDKENPQVYYLIGEIKYDLKETDSAILNYQKVVALNYHEPKIYQKLGELLEDKGLFLQAKETYQQAINLYSDNPVFYYKMANLERKEGNSNLDKLINIYQILIEICPDLIVNSYQNLANIYCQQKDFTKAFNSLQKALEIEPNNIHTNRNLASMYWQKQDIESAIFYCEKVLEIDKADASANNILSTIYLQRNELEKVSILMTNALEKQPNNPHLNWTFANFYRQKGDLEEAIKYYQKTLDLGFPNKFPVFNNMAEVFQQKGNIQEAINNYQKALEIDPNNIQVNRSLGKINIQEQKIDLGIPYFKKVLEIDSNDLGSLNMLAHIYVDKNELNIAATYSEKAINLAPNNPYVTFTFAKLNSKQGNLDEAIKYYQKSAEFGHPNKFFVFSTIAELNKQQGDIQAAIDNYQKALELQPDNEQIKIIINKYRQNIVQETR